MNSFNKLLRLPRTEFNKFLCYHLGLCFINIFHLVRYFAKQKNVSFSINKVKLNVTQFKQTFYLCSLPACYSQQRRDIIDAMCDCMYWLTFCFAKVKAQVNLFEIRIHRPCYWNIEHIDILNNNQWYILIIINTMCWWFLFFKKSLL